MTMGLPLATEPAAARPWGIHLVLDLHQCNPAKISDGETIRAFIGDLIERIKMTAFGEMFLVRFAVHDPKVAGYTVMQAIETSSITGHFVELTGNAHLDVFSCKEYDTADTAAFIADYFKARTYKAQVLYRG